MHLKTILIFGALFLFFYWAKMILKDLGNFISKFLVLILVGLLVLSFALWGVGDVLQSRVNNAVATVGDGIITKPELDNIVTFEARKLQGIFGNALTLEQIENLGLKNRVLTTLINRKLLEQEASDLGVKIGEKHIMDMLSSDPRFSDVQGNFNKDAFLTFLRNNGENEATFIAKLRNDLAVDILADLITASFNLPPVLASMLHEYEGEKRVAKLLTIPADYIKTTKDPNNTELLAYYEEKKQEFSAPEYRDITFVKLSTHDVVDQIDTSEEKLHEEYELRKDEFDIPEVRDLQQMFMPEEENAKAAYEMLKEKKSFSDVAKQKAGQGSDEISFGETTKKELSQGGLLPDEIVDAVFSLGVGDFTEPVESSLGWHIFRVIKIKPDKKHKFEEVRDELKKVLIDEHAGELLYSIAGEFEDELAAGSKLEEAAGKLGLKVYKTGSISLEGKKLNGIEGKDIPDFGNFINLAFNSEEGVDSQLVSSPDGDGYFILRVDGIIPPRVKALDEVRGLVADAWKVEQIKKDLKAFSEQAELNIKRKISEKNKDALESEAAMLLLESSISKPFYRDAERQKEIPAALVKELFSLKSESASRAYINVDGSYTIGVLKDIIESDEKDAVYNTDAVSKRMADETADDLISQYLLYLRSKYPIEYLGS